MNDEDSTPSQDRYVSFPRLENKDTLQYDTPNNTPNNTDWRHRKLIMADNSDFNKEICCVEEMNKMEKQEKGDEPPCFTGSGESEIIQSERDSRASNEDERNCYVKNVAPTLYTNCQCAPGDTDREQPVTCQGHTDRYNRDQNQRAPASPSSTPNTNPPDGGWGWVVCATCLWVNGTVMGTSNTFGILYNHMRELNAQGDDEVSLKTSFVGSCMNGVMFLMSCVSGILCDVIGLRHTAVLGGFFCMLGFFSSAFVSQLELLYLTYGVLLGSGFGLVFSPMVAITGHYFKKNLGMVNGIVTFGASAFTVALSFALPYLLKYFGLKATLLGYAGLGLVLTMCTLAWKPLISREYVNESEMRGEKNHLKHCLTFVMRKVLNGQVWKNKRFLCWSLAMSISRFGYLEPYFHMVNHVTHVLPGSNASILITIMAAVSGVSKLIVGKLSDLIREYRIYIQQGALLMYGVVVICVPFSTTFPGFVVIAVFLGFADAVIMALYGPNAIELVGAGNASQAVGFSSLLGIPTFLSAPVITGSMHDHLKSYNLGFHVTGAITLLASMLMCLVASPFKNKIPSKSPVARSTSDTQTTSDQGNGGSHKEDAKYDDDNKGSRGYINNAYVSHDAVTPSPVETRL